MKQQAELTAKRWDYCAEGYSDIIQKEFVEVGDTWERLLRENTPAGAKRALDVGTGPGFFAMLLSMQGLESVGVDCSERMVAQASANAAARGLTVRFETMDSHELRFADNLTNESPWDYALGALDMEGLSFDGFDFDLSNFFAENEEVVEDDYEPLIIAKVELSDCCYLFSEFHV